MLIFRDEKDNQILKFYTEEVEDKSIRIFSTEKNPEYYTKVYDENLGSGLSARWQMNANGKL